MRFPRIFLAVLVALAGGLVLGGCDVHVSACNTPGTYTASNVRYLLDNDLVSDFNDGHLCLSINAGQSADDPATVTNVTLDCQGHNPGVVQVYQAVTLQVTNCHFDHDAYLQLIRVQGAEVDHNRWRSDSVVLTTGGSCQLADEGSTDSYIHDNDLDGGAVSFQAYTQGYDDGICPDWWVSGSGTKTANTGGRIVNNTLSRYWDAAIELEGSVYDAHYNGNSIADAKIGIGGWYFKDFRRIDTSGNTFTNVGTPIYFP